MNLDKFLTSKHCYTAVCLDDAMKDNATEGDIYEALYQITLTHICCVEANVKTLNYFKKAIEWRKKQLKGKKLC